MRGFVRDNIYMDLNKQVIRIAVLMLVWFQHKDSSRLLE